MKKDENYLYEYEDMDMEEILENDIEENEEFHVVDFGDEIEQAIKAAKVTMLRKEKTRKKTLTGAAVIVLVIAAGVFGVSAAVLKEKTADSAQVGNQTVNTSTAQPYNEKEQKDYQKESYEGDVIVSMSITSVQKDLKIKFVDAKLGSLVENVPFVVNVTDPDGNTSVWSDEDMDGIIYKKDIIEGSYKVAMKALTDAEYQDYGIGTDIKSVEVKKEIDYQKIDVANEIKKESEVDAGEDAKRYEAAVESSLTDTVSWVESRMVDVTYMEVAKDSIPSPLKLAVNKSFSRMAATGTVTGNDPVATPVVGAMSFDKPVVSVSAGQSATVITTVIGFEVEDWTAVSTNTAVATVVSDRHVLTVTGVSAGTANIEVTATGEDKETASAVFAVKVDGTSRTIVLDKTATEVFMGEPVVINASISNAASEKSVVKAESSDTGIATVSVNNRAVTITGVAAGSCTVTVKYTENGGTVTAACAVTVKQNPREDTATRLKDRSGNLLYVNDSGTYREAFYADYFEYDTFYLKSAAKYTGWQTLEGKVYYFTADGNRVTGEQVIQGAKYTFAGDGSLIKGSSVGIAVSKWNGTINWEAVKNAGIEYAVIRCGYRGASQGNLIENPEFENNIRGATAAGLKVGVYFFTQAVDEREAVEEASMVLNQIESYKIPYPVFLEVEPSGGRGDSVSRETRTAVCRAFCQTIQNEGYTAGIYSNKTWLEAEMDASALSDYKVWLVQYAAAPAYTGHYDLWQYRSTGNVTGISGDVDMNISYLGY